MSGGIRGVEIQLGGTGIFFLGASGEPAGPGLCGWKSECGMLWPSLLSEQCPRSDSPSCMQQTSKQPEGPPAVSPAPLSLGSHTLVGVLLCECLQVSSPLFDMLHPLIAPWTVVMGAVGPGSCRCFSAWLFSVHTGAWRHWRGGKLVVGTASVC